MLSIRNGEEGGTGKVNLYQNSELNSIVEGIGAETAGRNSFENVVIRTVEAFSVENRIDEIDVSKIDAEGYDLKVLKGAESFLRGNRVGIILCEVGFNEEDLRHNSFFSIHEYVRANGFEIYGFYDLAHIPRTFRLDSCNALFVNSRFFES